MAEQKDSFKSLMRVALVVTLVVLVLDQWSKIWVKTNMLLGQDIEIFSWFIIHFTENPGMAFGLEFGGDYGKLALSVFRIFAVGGIGWYIYSLAKKGAPRGVILNVSLVFAGAIGNIIDSVFYGVIFSDSYHQIATMFPEGGGYGTWLHGRVVDMLYFPLFEGQFPDWLPIWGGEHFSFFRPVFNLADSAITIGVVGLLLFQKQFLKEDGASSKPEAPTEN